MTIGNTMQSRNPNHNKYLILETSFFHSKQDLRKFEGQTGIKVIFLPPHTPMLNPTEYLFNEMKQLVKSKSNKHHRTHADIVSELLETLKDKSMQGYYSCIRPYL
jgi:transposase